MPDYFPNIRARVEDHDKYGVESAFPGDAGEVLEALDDLAAYTKRLEGYARAHSRIALSHGEGQYDDVLVERRDALPDDIKEFLDA